MGLKEERRISWSPLICWPEIALQGIDQVFEDVDPTEYDHNLKRQGEGHPDKHAASGKDSVGSTNF